VSAPAQISDRLVELCAFAAGDEEYLIDLRRVREIVPPVPVTSVPRAPGFVEGVAHLRGAVVPVVDVRKRLGVRPREPGRLARFLVVEVAGQTLALLVDAVIEVVRVPRSELRPTGGLTGRSGPRLFLGVCRATGSRRGPGRLRLLLDVKGLLEPLAPGAAEAERLRAREADER
jgi:purine-binding chemotaxis protein CheW